MKNYKMEKISMPILQNCYCDKCKEYFEEHELIEIQFQLADKKTMYINTIHGEYCPECLHSLLKDHCRYNFDLGEDYDLDEHMKIMKGVFIGEKP
jgi:hypothetical protein